MMTFPRLVNYVGAEPFRPFRIKMTSGKVYEIPHPEMIAVGRTTAHVFTWMNEDNNDLKDRELEIAILLIESIEALKQSDRQHQS